MKRTFTFLPVSFLALVAIIASTFLVTSASAQSAPVALAYDYVADAKPAGAWKAPDECAAIIATERANTAVLLADPALKPTQSALYYGYDRMLGYMEAALAVQVPVDDFVVIEYKKVLAEATTDPTLQNMSTAEFSALYDALISQLIQQ